MNKILLHAPLFLAAILIFFMACEGPRGPAGPPGEAELPASFEYNATLVADNEFAFCHDIPGEIEVYDSDVLMAFLFEDETDEGFEVWQQLPFTEYTNRGSRTFNFDFTMLDVCVNLSAGYPLTSSDEFDILLIRAVHIPAGFVPERNMQAVKEAESPGELESLLGVDIRAVR